MIVPSFTWVASANVAAHCGATPVLCDIDMATYNIDPAEIEPPEVSRNKWSDLECQYIRRFCKHMHCWHHFKVGGSFRSLCDRRVGLVGGRPADGGESRAGCARPQSGRAPSGLRPGVPPPGGGSTAPPTGGAGGTSGTGDAGGVGFSEALVETNTFRMS